MSPFQKKRIREYVHKAWFYLADSFTTPRERPMRLSSTRCSTSRILKSSQTERSISCSKKHIYIPDYGSKEKVRTTLINDLKKKIEKRGLVEKRIKSDHDAIMKKKERFMQENQKIRDMLISYKSKRIVIL